MDSIKPRCCCSSSSSPSPRFSTARSKEEEPADCYYKAAEFCCSGCLFCVSCPLCVVWCCVKLPCKIGWKAAKKFGDWICCGSEKKVFASYSSFSDIDSDSLPDKLGQLDASSGKTRVMLNSSGKTSRRFQCGR
ncbi:uncharacterized protein LOC126687420 [Mercurialis annua]|uniref:uncharacterized protein LOC126687420 n=1 Tax=Mercurialis annua TaxID=3986 RepID=UPI002160B80C|nr:uncharacterized protein LOC126687420 [Mercurialis annua]